MRKKKEARVIESSMVFSYEMTKWYREYNFLYFKNRALPNIDVYYAKIVAPKNEFAY